MKKHFFIINIKISQDICLQICLLLFALHDTYLNFNNSYRVYNYYVYTHATLHCKSSLLFVIFASCPNMDMVLIFLLYAIYS